MLSAILHLGLAVIALVGGLAVYRTWKRQKFSQEATFKYFFAFFVFLILYHLCLALPYFVFAGNLFLMAWGYIFGVAFIFLIILFIFKMMAYLLGLSARRSLNLEIAILFLGILVFVIQAFDFRLPIILPSNFIVWNNSLPVGALIFVSSLSITLFFISAFLKNLNKADETVEKVKMYFLIAGSLFIGLSTIYFIARTPFFILLAFITHFFAVVFFSAAFLAHRRIWVKR